jgi:glycosyltransferase involved in cell wall biosynthesis
MKASVIIVTKNNEKHIAKLLEALAYQDFKDFEVSIVDLCSTDKTLSYAKPFPVKAFRLESGEKNIPHALNLASKLCTGDIIFALRGSSVPKNNSYLSTGLRSFNHIETALTFGPRLKYNETPLVKLLTLNLWNAVNDEIEMIGQNQLKEIQLENCAYRKYVWQNNHFPENEDTAVWDWSSYIIELGYEIAYNPQMSVMAYEKTGLISYFKEKRKRKKLYSVFRKGAG